MGSAVVHVAGGWHLAEIQRRAPVVESGSVSWVAYRAPDVAMCPCYLLGVVVSWKGLQSWSDRPG